MSEDKNEALPEGLAEHLVRSYASGKTNEESTAGFVADENDVAAFVRGDLLPPRLNAFNKALLQDQGLRAAVDFERQIWGQDLAITRRSFWGIRGLAAAAAIALVSFVGWNAYQASNQPKPSRETLAEATQLEATRGLSLDQLTTALSPTELSDLAKSGGVMRSSDSIKSRFAGPTGAILSTRPDIIIEGGNGALAVRIFAQDELSRHLGQWEVSSAQQGRTSLKLSAEIPDLKPGTRYGLEMSDRNGNELGTCSFVVAQTETADMINAALSAADAKFASEKPAALALRKASLLTKEKFYFDAMLLLDTIPSGDRSAPTQKLLAGLRKLMSLQ